MKTTVNHERLAGAAAWLYCVWQARDLQHAWLHSPFDRAGSAAFLIWCLPPVLCLFRREAVRQGWLAAGVLLSLAGVLTEVNFVKYLGFATVTAGFVPASRFFWLWLAAAVSWMPVLGWLLGATGPVFVHAVRLVLSMAPAAVLLMRPSSILSR